MLSTGTEPAKEGLIDLIEKWVAGISLGIAALLVFLAVIMRFLFHYSISAFDELTRYLIIWSTFISGSRLLHKNGHITIDVLIIRLSERSRLILQTGAFILGALFCIILAYNGLILVKQSILLDARSMSKLRMPMWIPQLSVPIGALLMFWRFIEKIREYIRRLKSLSS